MTVRNLLARGLGGFLMLVGSSTALATGCQSTPAATGGAQMCVYGEAIDCVPDSGSRGGCTRTCLPDLSDYGPCLCVSDGGKKDAR